MRLRLACCLAIGIGSLAGAGEALAVKQPHVLVIGIDGLRPDALKQARTPHLDRLRREGAYADKVEILAPRPTHNDTVSGPGWSTILTGVWSDKHGVLDNEFKGANYAEYPHFFARLKAAQPQAHTVSLVTWKPIQEKIVTAADVSEYLELKGGSRAQRDERLARRAAELLTASDPTAMFAYLLQVDEAGHEFGFHPSVPQYVEAIENADACVGTIMAALQKRRSFAGEDWLIIVCTDHGGRGTSHSQGHDYPEVRNVFLILHGATIAPGTVLGERAYLPDVAVTALTHLGVPIDPAWKLDGRSLLR